MLVALDLTPRQAARVLAQAVQTRAKLEIEPRPDGCRALLWGTLIGAERDLLRVELHDRGHELPLASLVGAACDVRAILSGQLYLFSTFVIDVADNTTPQRLVLAAPDSVQVANRRRFVRSTPLEPVAVRLAVAGAREPLATDLVQIGPGGLACRAAAAAAEDALFIGDAAQVEFLLPWASTVFTLAATVCSKTRGPDRDHVTVGLEFALAADGTAPPDLERLRAALADETARLSESNGDL